MKNHIKRRLVKSWEGEAPFLVLQLSFWRPPSPLELGLDKRYFLVLDAQQKQAGARFLDEKPDGLKPQGSVVSILRKHCPTAGLSGVFQGGNGDIWLPLFTSPGNTGDADFYLQLANETPPELRFLSKDGTALMRRNSTATFTKRRSRQELFPPTLPWPPDFTVMTDLLAPLLGCPENAAQSAQDPEQDRLVQVDPKLMPELLPDYQRVARDKISRRFKTMRKALEKMQRDMTSDQDIRKAEHEAALLRTYLHLVQEGQLLLALSSEQTGGESLALELNPEKSPGQNLEDRFTQIKKFKKGRLIGRDRLVEAQAAVRHLESDLTTLRETPLSAQEVERILARHKLSPPSLKRHKAHVPTPVAKPFRIYHLGPPDALILCLVGKGASDNDEMTKAAKANDLWLHAVGTTGSHILLPAKGLKKQLGNTAGPKGQPSLPVLREAAILALHFSKKRDDQAGEVYVTKRQHLRKRRGMAVGLWQVDKSETIFIRYDDAELKAVLGKVGDAD